MRDQPLCGASLDTLADRIWPGVAHFGPIPVLSASGSRRPFPRYVIVVLLSEQDQCRRLAGNRVLLLLLDGGNSSVNRGILPRERL
jgi:hypothetical protein